jgi:hypothetical protein
MSIHYYSYVHDIFINFSCYHFLFYIVLVVWSFELLMCVPIQLVLFPSSVRFISVLNLRSDISVFESRPIIICSNPNSTKNIVENMVKTKSNPIRSV